MWLQQKCKRSLAYLPKKESSFLIGLSSGSRSLMRHVPRVNAWITTLYY